MSIVHVTGGGGGISAERTFFFGPTVPKEIKTMTKQMKNIDRAIFRKLLQIAVADIEKSQIESGQFQDLKSDKCSEETLSFVYSGLYSLLRLALRMPLKSEVFKEDLQEMKIPREFIPDLLSAVCGSKGKALEEKSTETKPRLPRLDTFRWRVDVGISTSALNRVLQPTILAEMTSSDGKIHNFEISMSKFHQLRYNVATVLKEMEDLEKRNILKIAD